MGGLFSKNKDKKTESRVTDQDRAILVGYFCLTLIQTCGQSKFGPYFDRYLNLLISSDSPGCTTSAN